MTGKNGLFIISLLVLAFAGMIGNSGCANIVPPLGGPRDTLPPRLVSVVPRDGNTGMPIGTPKIVFTFDEYIDSKDIRNELIVSPVSKVEPVVDAKLRVMTVRMKDTLQPNTTYTFDFGKGVKDVNEGNILKGFSYSFSTGRYIDSMTLSGSVIVANTGKPDSTLIVFLHNKLDDSAVVKERPRYITRVDTLGQFNFRHLAPGTYALYAMKDEGGTHRYMSKTQLFAFSDSNIVIAGATRPQALFAYAEGGDSKSGKPGVGGGKPGSGGPGGGNKPGGAATKPTEKKDKKDDKRLTFQVNVSNGQFDVLDTFALTFTSPLKTFDSTKIRLTDEKFNTISPKEYRIRRDTSNTKFAFLFNWPTDTKYNMILAKDFASDSLGKELLKIDTLSFHTKKDIDYGEVRLRFMNLDVKRNPVLQFIVQDQVKYAFPFNGGREFRRILFAPGEYELRILYDTNKNGIWDAGEFFGKHRQPEKVTPIKKKLNVKANWDNDQDITL